MSHRRVHFSDPLHQIKYLDKEWDAASQLARDGSDWLLMGLDRQRFRDRIKRTAEILNGILEPKLRQRIYRERFENFVSTQDNQPDRDHLASTPSLGGEIVPKDKIDNKETYQAEPSIDQVDAPGQSIESKNSNSAYISWKKARQRRHKRGRGRNNKRGGKRKH